MKEILEYLERERQRGLNIHEEMDKLMERGEANDDQEILPLRLEVSV